MNDIPSLIDAYIATWNEGDPERRRALVVQTFTEDGSYVDPVMTGAGQDGIDAMIAGAQQQFPGHRFELAGEPDSHHDRVRFTWHLKGPDGGRVATGIDFGTLDGDGRLRAVTGFLE